MNSTAHFFYRVDPRHIGYVRFVVEAYEGIAQVRSLPGRYEVEWVVPIAAIDVATQLAGALHREIGLTPIPRPDDWPDWD